jgi:Cu(I)/Ag(I) efflux system membrane fusion protein
MHPSFVADRPGDCSICGMRLVLLEGGRASASADDGEGALATVVLTPEAIRLAGILTEPASVGQLARTLRTSGTVRADPERVRHILTRIAGWVEKLDVKATGTWVRKGQPLFTLYAPDFLPIQEEYLQFLTLAESDNRPDPSSEEQRRLLAQRKEVVRRRIERYGLPDDLVAALERGDPPRASLLFSAPASGYVQVGPIFEGQQVEAGTDLMTITDLSEVWVESDLFEGDIPQVRVGQEAAVVPPYEPPARLSARVIQINPFLDTANRTMTVRLSCRNETLALKVGMFATVEFEVSSGEGVVVPSSAVLDTGLRQVVFVEAEAGKFEPREVRVGLRTSGKVRILEGVSVGERVAVRGNFLLDAESRLKGGTARKESLETAH